MYLGIEIGGTKLQLGLGDCSGRLLPCGEIDGVPQTVVRGTVEPAAGAAGILRRIETLTALLFGQSQVSASQIRGVGIGFGGPFDDTTQRCIKSHHIAGWDDFPLTDWASKLLGTRAVVANDADVAGLGEARYGAGQGISPMVYMTVGTGIGGGLILNGEIYSAVGRGAAEIGHLKVLDWSRAGTPMMVSLEDVASGTGIGVRAREQAERGEAAGSKVLDYADGDPAKITGEHVGRAARRGDEFAKGVLSEATAAIAEALCQMIVLICPRRVVIGGGVSLLGDELFFEPIRRAVAERVFPPFAGLTDIVPAALGEEVVIHGAVALAAKAIGGTP